MKNEKGKYESEKSKYNKITQNFLSGTIHVKNQSHEILKN